MYYAILVIGYGKRSRYTLRKVVNDGLTVPVNYACYRSIEEAKQAAADLGIEIEKIGDAYQILP